jgi:hypothetical protein
MKRIIAILALIAGLGFLITGCKGSGQGAAEASSAKGAVASVTADPTVQAEIDQAKLLVKSCFPAAPLDQLHTVHLVFLSSATGKHGPEVVAARAKLFNCLGVPEDKRDDFKNDAITAAEHQKPKIISLHPVAGVTRYLEFTLPGLVFKYKGTAAGTGTSTAQPPVPGTSSGASTSPSPSVQASTSGAAA